MRCRERVQKCASPVSMVSASASAFIHANMRTSPVSASVTIAGINPSGPNFGWKTSPRSISSVDPREAKRGDGEAIQNRPDAIPESHPGPFARDPAIHKTGASGRVDPGDERRDDTVVDSASASARVRQTKKAVTQSGISGKGAKKARGHSGDTGLMNAAHGHAL